MFINFDTDKLKPYAFNFAIMKSCGKESKAFERSAKRDPNILPLTTHFLSWLEDSAAH